MSETKKVIGLFFWIGLFQNSYKRYHQSSQIFDITIFFGEWGPKKAYVLLVTEDPLYILSLPQTTTMIK